MAFNLVLTKDKRNQRQKAEVYKTILQSSGFPLHTSTAVANAITAGAAAKLSADKTWH